MRATTHVSLDNHQGSIRFRLLLPDCKRSFKLGLPYSEEGIEKAKTLAKTIENDIHRGTFDYSLQRYAETYRTPHTREHLFLLWDRWVESLRIPDHTRESHHDYVRTMIVTAQARLHDASWFSEVGQNLSASTYNQRLSYLKSFYTWLIDQGIANVNPFLKVSPRKRIPPRVRPFTVHEVTAILKAFKENTYCPKSSPYKHSILYPFTYFLFKSGCRTSEAIGLRVRDVDFTGRLVFIGSALVRASRTCSTGSKRVRKGTKSEYSVRTLPLTPDLEELLKPLCSERHPDDLVFTSAKGMPIDDRNYRNRYWKPILDGLGLEYRKPYTTRHTAASLSLSQGSTIHEVAAMLGHGDPSLVLSTYGHLLHDIKLPDLT